MWRLFVLLPLAVLACSSPTEPEYRSVLAQITLEGEAPEVSITIEGRTVRLEFITWGTAGCTRTGRTDWGVERQTARVLPYDLAPPAGTTCYRMVSRHEHEAALLFPEAGAAQIILQGRAESGELVEYTYDVDLTES